VLQYLVGVHDVERVVRKVEFMHVGGGKRDIGQLAPFDLGVGHVENVGELVDGHHGARCDPGGQVGRDRSGPAPNVEQRCPRNQVGQ